MKLPVLLLFLIITFSYTYAEEVTITTFHGQDPITESSIAIMTEAYKRIGVAMKIAPQPAERSLRSSNYGASDGELFRIKQIDKEFDNLLRLPVAIAKIQMVAFSKAHSTIKIDGWESLSNYMVSYHRGVKIVEYNLIDPEKLIPSNSVKNALLMLSANRTEVAIDARLNMLKIIQDLKLKDIVEHTPPVETIYGYHYLHKNKRHLLSPLITELKDMETSGVIKQHQERVANKYLP